MNTSRANPGVWSTVQLNCDRHRHGVSWGRCWLFGALLLLPCASIPACAPADRPAADAAELRIAIGTESGVSSDIGSALAERYQASLPSLRVTTRFAQGVDGNLLALEKGEADVGFVDAEGAYIAYRRTNGSVRAIAGLYPTAVQIFVKRSLNIRSVSDLSGHEVIVGERGDYADRAMQLVLQSYDLDYARVHPRFETGPAAAELLREGRASAIVFYVPFRRVPTIQLATDFDMALLPIAHENIARIQLATERNHFVKTIAVPAGTYPGQERDVLTMGDEILLVCRTDLDDRLVYSLTKVLFEAVPALVKANPAAATIEVGHGPTTSLPLHAGAARYYRERELPR